MSVYYPQKNYLFLPFFPITYILAYSKDFSVFSDYKQRE